MFRYASRPVCMDNICLAQFATHYTFTRKVPKSVEFDDETGASKELSNRKIFNQEHCLPKYLKLSDENQFMRLRGMPAVLRIHRSDRKEGHEQHYSELLLYTPWSNEEVDLQRTFDACLAQYRSCEDTIESVKRQIFLGEDTVQMLDADLEENRPIPIYDQIDPQREQELDDDRDEGLIDDPNYAAMNYGDEFNDEAPKPEQFKFKQIDIPDEDKLNIMTRRLVPEQHRILLKIVHYCKEVLKARNSPHERPSPIRIIVTGGAGVGKSATIRVITYHAEKILRKAGDHPHKPRIMVCAPTGKAASLIDGQTIHTAFNFQFGTANEHNTLSDKKKAEMRELLSELRLIIIDEVSMLGSDMLFRIHLRLTEIFQCDDLFANKSIMLVGDLLQLPPVMQSCVFLDPTSTHFQAFNNVVPLWRSFEPYVLEHNHRQKEEMRWANNLNEVRIGNVTKEVEDILKSRITSDPWLQEDAMHVFFTNKEVGEHNKKMLNTLKTPLVTVVSTQRNPGKFRPYVTDWGTVQKTQFMDKLHLKIGARVSLIVNVNTLDELVNGALGTVVGFEKNSNGDVTSVVVAFDSNECGREQRAKYPIIAEKYKDENGTPIMRHELEYAIESRRGKKQTAKASVCNFPLKLSWANTAHKMQGITVKAGSKLICHGNKKMRPGMAYVMLGRCERLEDVYITKDFDVSKIKCDTASLIESRRINDIARNRADEELNLYEATYTFGYLNVRSLALHIEDIKGLLESFKFDMIAFGETWLHPGQTVQMEGWLTKYENVGRGKGLAVMSEVEFEMIKSCSKENMSAAVSRANGVCCIFLYLSKGYEWKALKEILDEWIDSNVPTIVMGDVNWHWNGNGKNSMKAYMKSRNFNQLIARTTHEDGNIIDHIYANDHFPENSLRVNQQSVTFSDHDMISVSVSPLQ